MDASLTLAIQLAKNAGESERRENGIRRPRSTEPFCDPKAQQINPGRSPDHRLDRNGVDDGIGATAATGIHRRDGSSGSGRRGSSKVRLAGIRG